MQFSSKSAANDFLELYILVLHSGTTMKRKVVHTKEIRRERPMNRVYTRSRVWAVIEKKFVNMSFTTLDLAKEFEKEFGKTISGKQCRWFLSRYVKLGHITIVGRQGKHILHSVSKEITSAKEGIHKDSKHADTEQSLLNIATNEILHIYEKMKKTVLSFGSVKTIPRKRYVEFVHNWGFAFIVIGESELTVYLDLPKGLVLLSGSFHTTVLGVQ
jgi:hypothetical protein